VFRKSRGGRAKTRSLPPRRPPLQSNTTHFWPPSLQVQSMSLGWTWSAFAVSSLPSFLPATRRKTRARRPRRRFPPHRRVRQTRTRATPQYTQAHKLLHESGTPSTQESRRQRLEADSAHKEGKNFNA
jgi:hypothetical protein